MTSNAILDTRAQPRDKGKQLMQFLRDKFPSLTTTAAKMLVRLDGVWVNEINIRNPQHILRGEETIFIPEASVPIKGVRRAQGDGAPLVDNRFKEWVIHEDDHLLVINKPPGVSAQSQDGDQQEEIVRMARSYLGARSQGGGRNNRRPNHFLSLVHRIDRNTSGVLVFAKSPQMMKRLTQMFRSNAVKKQHLVLVKGVIKNDRETLKHLISKNAQDNRAIIFEMTTAVDPSDRTKKKAIAHLEVKERFSLATLVLATMETDHSHQIRAQLAHIGHPILGDQKYGGALDASFPPKLLSQGRMGMHAYQLSFENPATQRMMHLKAELSQDLKAALETLRPAK